MASSKLTMRDFLARLLLDPILKWVGRLELGERICLDCRDDNCACCAGTCVHDCPPETWERRYY